MITRTNRLGLLYQITRVSNTETRISCKGQSIVVKATFDEVVVSWYKWMMKNEFIQDAFPYFNADEREFLVTGLTVEEWDKLLED